MMIAKLGAAMESRMNTKIGMASGLVVLLALPVSSAQAGGGDFLVGVVVGAVGKTIVDDIRKKNRNHSTRAPSSRPSAAQRERNAAAAAERQAQRDHIRDVQTRLNALYFDAGTPDGVSGRNTRRAISAFQTAIGVPATGTLTDQQYQHLVTATTAQQPDMAAPMQPLPQLVPNTNLANGPDLNGGVPLMDTSLPEPSPLPTLNLEQGGVAAQLATTDGVEQVSSDIDGAVSPEFAVFGIRTQESGAEVGAKLAGNGFSDCETSPTFVTCTNSSDATVDTISVGLTTNGQQSTVHTVSRTIEFSSAVPRSAIVSKMAQAYPTLASDPSGLVLSSANCAQVAQSFHSNSFAELKSWMASGGPATGRVALLAAQCNYAYSMTMPDGDAVQSIDVTFFSGRPILQALSDGGPVASADSPQVDIRF